MHFTDADRLSTSGPATGFRNPYSVHGGGDNVSGISRAFATGVQSWNYRVFKGMRISGNSSRRTGAGFDPNDHRFLRHIPPHFMFEFSDPFLQSFYKRIRLLLGQAH